MRKRLLTVALISALILISAAIFFSIKRSAERKSDEKQPTDAVATKPSCDGLNCYDDSDCGSRCYCSRDAGAALGKCVARR